MKFQYRPEIDGLRAVAVLAVVLYHAKFVLYDTTLVQGGYVGVDVFFVISGYLITRIILSGLKDDSFSFLKFYERRARRILPALFTVMIVSIPFAWMYLLPREMKDYAGSVLSSLFFVSNYWFASGGGYWGGPSDLKPFLHTWSLSVEEQFYIIFPIALIYIWRRAPRYVLPIFGFGAIASILLAEAFVGSNPEFAFFHLPTRGWELLAGAILAKIELDRGRGDQKFISKFAPALGIGLIIYACLYFDSGTRHPSLITALPVVGTMLIIWYGRKGELISDLLASRIPVGIGLVSYGFYLWHYPAFAFARINFEELTSLDKLALILLSFSLAVISYFLIEKPVRVGGRINKKQLAFGLSSVVIVIASFQAVLFSSGGSWRFEAWQMRLITQPEGDLKKYLASNYNRIGGKTFGNDSRHKLMIIGDSLSMDFYNVLNESNLLDDRIEMVGYFLPWGCVNAPKDSEPEKEVLDKHQFLCSKYQRVGDAQLNSMISKADSVILASAWNDFSAAQIDRLESQILDLGVKNVLVVGRKQFRKLKNRDLANLGFEQITALERPVSQRLFTMNLKMKNKKLSRFLDLHEVVCGKDRGCPVTTPDGHAITYDEVHLTREGAIYIGSKIKNDPVFVEFWDIALAGENKANIAKKND